MCQKSQRRSQNLDPCNPNFFMINQNQRLCVFQIIITSLFQALMGGDGITLQNVLNYDDFKSLIFLGKPVCSPCCEVNSFFVTYSSLFSKNWMVQRFAHTFD
jgi:hypothetical protein